MSTVFLPHSPGPRTVTMVPVDFGATLRGPLGGSAQRLNRLGDRWSMQVEMPPMTADDARAWSAALTRGLSNGVLLKVQQPNLDAGSPGSPLVAGADQVGSTLNADGFTPGYQLKVGQFFSIVASSRRYLHQVAANVTATGGSAAIAITPRLRVSPEDNAILEVAVPNIEGLLAEVPSWFYQHDRIARGFAFTIEEAK